MNLFTVIYRTGGTRNFEWHRCALAVPLPEAEITAEQIRRMGYVAHVEHHNLSVSVGLPETYSVGGDPVDPADYIEYEDRQEVLHAMRRLPDLDGSPEDHA